jgi:hypothetical protein
MKSGAAAPEVAGPRAGLATTNSTMEINGDCDEAQ